MYACTPPCTDASTRAHCAVRLYREVLRRYYTTYVMKVDDDTWVNVDVLPSVMSRMQPKRTYNAPPQLRTQCSVFKNGFLSVFHYAIQGPHERLHKNPQHRPASKETVTVLLCSTQTLSLFHYVFLFLTDVHVHLHVCACVCVCVHVHVHVCVYMCVRARATSH